MSVRTENEQEIYDLLDDVDPSGKNTERVRSFFKSMGDRQWYEFMDEYYSNEDKYIPVAYAPYDNPVTLDFIHEVARKHNVPVYEIVYRPYLNGDVDDPPGTVHEQMVIDVPVKPLKQMTMTKNHASTAAGKRDPKTGQVSGEDRTARVTDVEAFSLLALGQYHAAQEFYGPMADDNKAQFEMLRSIQRNGEVELAELPNDRLSKVTLNTINALMLGSCVESNFVSEQGYVLPITMQGRDERSSTIDRGGD